MKSPAPDEVSAAVCPLCGQPNGCALEAARATGAACAGSGLDCWCASQRIPTEVLARVPAAARGKACICQRCAQGQER